MNIRDYYQDKALNYGISGLRLIKILKLFEKTSDKKVLDVGCATGYLGKKIKELGNQVIGIDISQKAVTKAKKVLNDAVVVDLNNQKLPFKDQDFDYIIASEVIEHLFDGGSFLHEIHRVLKSNGTLIITTPNISFWQHRYNLLLGKFEYQKEGPFDESHIHFFNNSSLT